MDYDLVIVGAGTVGLTLANLIAENSNLKIALIEKLNNIYEFPRAVGIDSDTLKTCSKLSCYEYILNFVQFKARNEKIFSYVDKNKNELFSIFEESEDENFPMGSVFLQHKVDDVLLSNLKKKDNVSIFMGSEVKSFTQDGNEVVTHFSNQKNQLLNISSQYLIACDGGKSDVRKMLGFKMKGYSDKNNWLIIDIKVKKQDYDYVSVFLKKRFTAVNVPLPNNYSRWEILISDYKNNSSNFSENDAREILNKYIENKDYNIIRHIVYKFNNRISNRYFKNRIVLVGDSAHVVPPFAANGLTSGIADAEYLYGEIINLCGSGHNINTFLKYEKNRRRIQIKNNKIARILGNLMIINSSLKETIIYSLFKIINSTNFLKSKFSIRKK